MKHFIYFLPFVLLFSKSFGQSQWCGTISTEDPPIPLYELLGPIQILVFFHIILSSAG